MKFGDYLRLQREQKSWTQPEAAAKAGIEQSYLSKLETGKSYPSEEIFERIVEAYGIDTADMSDAISSAELDRLREIRDVRSVVLERQKSATLFVRGWLVAGLLFLMAGGACYGLSQIPGGTTQEFYYRSTGVLLPDEDINAFAIVQQRIHVNPQDREPGEALLARKKEMTERIDQHDLTTARFRGNYFVEEVPDGRRFYEFYGDMEMDVASPFGWFSVPALMFLAGSLGCFYISYRWR